MTAAERQRENLVERERERERLSTALSTLNNQIRFNPSRSGRRLRYSIHINTL